MPVFERADLVEAAERARRFAGDAGEAFLDGKTKQRRAHIHDEEERGHRRCAGIAIRGERHRHAMLAEQRDRRRLRLPQHVIGARQQHRHGAGRCHGGDAVRVGVFEMIGRESAGLGSKPCAARIRQLVGMQLDRQPGRPSRRENPPRLLGREPDVLLAEPIDRVRQPLARDRREHVVADGGDVGVLVAVRFRRQRMGAEERRHDRHRPLDAEPARRAQQAGLGVEIEPVTGLDLRPW